jgi:hypothetical protein
MYELPLTPERKKMALLQQIAQNNNFSQKLQQRPNFQTQRKLTNQDQTNERRKKKPWTTSTYYRPVIRTIPNLFKHTNVGISFKNTNILQQLKNQKTFSYTQDQDKSGIYKLTCNTSKMSYIGQTSRSLKQRYQVYIRYKDPPSA